jgi:hypothetical protein
MNGRDWFKIVRLASLGWGVLAVLPWATFMRGPGGEIKRLDDLLAHTRLLTPTRVQS